MLKEEIDYTLYEAEELEGKEKFPSFPLPILIERAEGVYLFDSEGKKYLDLTANKDNNPFGYSNTNIKSENCFMDSGLFLSNLSKNLEKNLKKLTALDKVYFSSNTEEIYKLAHTLINSYLSRFDKDKILVSCSSSDKSLYKINGFQIDIIPANSETLLKTTFSRNVGAVIIQLAQISSDIIIPQNDYLYEVKALCDKNNALLIFDSANISPLRLNKGLFNYSDEVKPDILIVSKGLSNGFPLNAVVTSDKVSLQEAFSPKAGIYSQAYSLANQLIEDFDDKKRKIDSIREYLDKKLGELSDTHISLVDYFSTGILYSIIVDFSAYEFAKEAFEKGIIVDTLDDYKIMLAPPYNINEPEIDHFLSVFDEIFDKLAEFDRLR